MFAVTGMFASLAFAGQVLAHGYISSPAPRSSSIGSAFSAACGEQAFYQQSSDKAGNVQGELQVASIASADACNLWLCKGYQFEDNVANVQSYTAGEAVDFQINIVAPHTGFANVSIVDTASNTIIGEPLISFEDYASTSTGVTSDETSFSVTIPEGLDQCSEAGACVLQWFWHSDAVDQTYEDCIDFTVGGGSSPAPSSSVEAPVEPSSSTVPEPSSSAPASSSVPPVEEPSASPSVTSVIVSETPSTSAVETSVVASETPSTPVEPTSIVESPAPSSVVVPAEPSTTETPVVTTTAPSTPVSSVAPPTPTGTCTKDGYNCCMDAYNQCADKANANSRGGGVDFSTCESERTTCMAGLTRRHPRDFF